MKKNRLLKILEEVNEQSKSFVDSETKIFLKETFGTGGRNAKRRETRGFWRSQKNRSGKMYQNIDTDTAMVAGTG